MIGRRWKYGNVLSLTILIGRGLDFKNKTETNSRMVNVLSLLFTVQLSRCGRKTDTVSGDNSEGVPPVPIPNTEVKPFSADGTWLDTARENRTPPDSNKAAE